MKNGTKGENMRAITMDFVGGREGIGILSGYFLCEVSYENYNGLKKIIIIVENLNMI
jgi:hypothetical protein